MEVTGIFGRPLLIVGYAHFGRPFARLARGFVMEVRAVAPSLAKGDWPAVGTEPAAWLAEGLARLDAVWLHVSNARRAGLALLWPGAIPIDAVRGGVVDEAALVEALVSRRIGAAGLVVFDAEPPVADHPLLAFDRAIR